jgi:hypothetical protein
MKLAHPLVIAEGGSIPAYWDGLIQALSQNTDDVAEWCIEEAGELCSFYLRVVPPGLGCRDLIARLALALGQKAKQSGHSYGYGVSKTVYEAVLRAAQELPEEVAELALTFAERKPVIEQGFCAVSRFHLNSALTAS